MKNFFKKYKKITIATAVTLVLLIVGISVFFVKDFVTKRNTEIDLNNEKLYNQYIAEWTETSQCVIEKHLTSSKLYTKEKNELVNRVASAFGYEKEINSREKAIEFSTGYLNQLNKQPLAQNDTIMFERISIIFNQYFTKMPKAKSKNFSFWYSPDYAVVFYAEKDATVQNLNEKLPKETQSNIKQHTNTWISLPDGKIAPKDSQINIICAGNGSYEIIGSRKPNSTVTIKSIPENGFELDGFYNLNEELLSEETSYAMVLKDKNDIIIKYKTRTYSITAEYGGGYVKGTGVFNYKDKVTLEAVPSKGYVFEGYYVNNKCVSNEIKYTFEVTDDIIFYAKFTKQ